MIITEIRHTFQDNSRRSVGALCITGTRRGEVCSLVRKNCPVRILSLFCHCFPDRCAGEIAAVPNTYCAVGVAYGAKVSGKEFSCELTYKAFFSYWAGFL